MQAANRVRTALMRGSGASLGLWQMMPSASVSRALARTPGVDWVMVDCEHGFIDDGAMHDTVPALAAAGVSPLVRIPAIESWMVKRALDSGAHGILVPLLRTRKEAEDLVKAAKFPPRGNRGFGSPLAMERFNPMPTMTQYLQEANDSLMTMVQIETQEALDDVEGIAAVEGVDVLFIGPFDLGNNIGFPIINGHLKPQLTEAIARILAATHSAGKKCGIFATSGEQARDFAGQGFDMVSVATDFTMMQQGVAEAVSVAGGKARPQKTGSY